MQIAIFIVAMARSDETTQWDHAAHTACTLLPLRHRFSRNGTVTGHERFHSTSSLSIVAKQFIWNSPHCILTLVSNRFPFLFAATCGPLRTAYILPVKNCTPDQGLTRPQDA
jgi:hypothetical protein